MGRHQISRPEPRGQRQLGVMNDRTGGHRGLPATASAFQSPQFGLQLPCFALATAWTDKALGPSRRKEVFDTGRLIREAMLKFDQGAGKVGHGGLLNGSCS